MSLATSCIAGLWSVGQPVNDWPGDRTLRAIQLSITTICHQPLAC